jgi:hypothetical protein
MDNIELMKILKQLSRSNRNKNLALFFGVAGVLCVGAAIYWNRKSNATQKENNKLSDKYQSLRMERNAYLNSIRQMKNEIFNQEIVIKKYAEKSFSPEKIDEGKV